MTERSRRDASEFEGGVRTLPSRSAVGGITVAVIAVTAIFTFSASLDRLLTSPSRWGYPWHLTLNFTSGEVDGAANELADDEMFTAVARWDSGFSYAGGARSRAFGLTPLRGDIGYTLRAGRQPAAVDEVVLGPATADRLDVTTGDVVNVAAGPRADPTPVQVVGIALFPEIDDGDLVNGVGYFRSGFARHATVPDLFEASQVVVTLAPGNDLGDITRLVNVRYPESVSGESVPAAPAGVGNLVGVRTLPRVIAVFVLALGLASLTHVLSSTVGRRRPDLATLRSLGLTPRQTVWCIVWQGVTIGAVGLALGVPLGLLAGRTAWSATVDPIGVSGDASRPLVGLLVVGAGTLLAAALLAIVVAWRSGRSAPAHALHAE